MGRRRPTAKGTAGCCGPGARAWCAGAKRDGRPSRGSGRGGGIGPRLDAERSRGRRRRGRRRRGRRRRGRRRRGGNNRRGGWDGRNQRGHRDAGSRGRRPHQGHGGVRAHHQVRHVAGGHHAQPGGSLGQRRRRIRRGHIPAQRGSLLTEALGARRGGSQMVGVLGCASGQPQGGGQSARQQRDDQDHERHPTNCRWLLGSTGHQVQPAFGSLGASYVGPLGSCAARRTGP